HQRRAGEVAMPTLGGPERAAGVADIELEEVMRQSIIEDRVLGIQPFAVQRQPIAEPARERRRVGAGPALEQIPVLLARAADEDVAAALQPQPRAGVERDPGIGAVELLLDDAEPAAQRVERDLLEVGIAGLQPRALEVPGARILVDLCHRTATATMWLST